jgi:glycosyltransferase involved in cell wall biosynthesis
MTILNNGFHDLAPVEPQARQPRKPAAPGRERPAPQRHHPSQEALRAVAWEIGQGRPADSYTPPAPHVGLAMVSPAEGFAHWRILHEWVDQTARRKGGAWHHCRPVLRLYDVSHIIFNGFNAHRLQDHTLPRLEGQLFFRLPRPGTWQLAEVGFLLRNGEFIPAARSPAVPFAPDAASSRGSHAALLVDGGGRVEEIENLWEQERILDERRRPRLRQPLRIAAFTFAAQASGQDGTSARFVSELAAGQCAGGHDVHVFVPATDALAVPRQVDGVHYHPLPVAPEGTPLERALAFGRVAEDRLRDLPAFDLVHLHEWMTGFVSCPGNCPVVLSLSSVEATRRNGTPPTALSREIEAAERRAVRAADCVLTPDWLRDRAAAELRAPADRVVPFPMEGRMPNEWEAPLDLGQVKMGVGVGPLDRLVLFVGPLEHAAGVDLLLEAVPVLLQRWPNLRVAYAGCGQMHGHLEHRAGQLGVSHAVRLLGHVEGPPLTRLLRSAEALVLPSRYRVPFDDAVVDLARRAGRPVVTTHGGPAHLVRHEETGVLTYDNPGSMVWAVDRVLGDPGHAERMGANGRRRQDGSVVWSEVARHYLELCAATFPELTETDW